ncbi:hypothetical protein RD110_13165 [Rhodoferax koreense]|uniref:Uncharacterized protein n=1 Tax=Rhodoferax koreensis TaxID=1842727 RepID=A0A1P8JW79_9BURK|nr:CHAT domain-containing protein [Rhodoferax koreense]APW38026.1 hypothetical protein RD110_13165 [Rhodoferax koreense]
MASRAQHDIGFTVPGQPVAAARGSPGPQHRGRVKLSVRIGPGASRDNVQSPQAGVTATARPGEDVVVLGLTDGPTLVLHPENARDLFRAQTEGLVRGAMKAADRQPVQVTAQLAWSGLTRGEAPQARTMIGQALLHGFDIVTGLPGAAAGLAGAAITVALDAQVETGLYALPDALSPGALPASLKGSGLLCVQPPPAAEGPLLVLLHGTFVDTIATFGQMWTQHPQQVQALFAHYAGQVYGFDHATLGQSPIANALALVRTLPDGARLHLLAHSRGGLVGEVLARACAPQPVDAADLAFFEGPAYGPQRNDLQHLVELARGKRIRVERVLRVGCPARGTLLASKRLDAYLSVLKWSLELAHVPVAPQLVDFLYEVARRRADPAELPGLEAMMPDNPMVRWLNQTPLPVPGTLRVVAGDTQGDSLATWVKTLLSDAFFWTDNDLVVQTRSMYGGVPRADGASFVLARGGHVSHFTYFANEASVAAVVAGLADNSPAGFKTIGPLSWAGQDTRGSRGPPPALRPRGVDAARPAVFLLPGILGSNLRRDGERIWLALRFVNGLKSLAWDPATAGHVEADGPVGQVYDRLIARLAETHEVIAFGYDWRRPTEDEARRLALAVDAALDARAASGQPVRLLAHSMGGLLARTMQLERPATWQRMMAHPRARLLMLGTPNAGSWSPMQVLSGDDNFGNALAAFGGLFDNRGAREVMAAMPGFLQLQAALLDPALRLDLATTWQQLADDDLARLRERSFWHDASLQLTAYQWGAPPQPVLDQAVALRRRLDAQALTLGADAAKMLLVAGHAPFTPDGITMGADGLSYLDAPGGGDGRVTLASARLPGGAAWQVDAAHGDLPGVAAAFPAYLELLETGTTQLLPRLPDAAPATRGAVDRHVPSRPSRGTQASQPPSDIADVFGTPLPATPSPRREGGLADPPLRVAVLNADLRFVHQPLVVGHYRSLLLTGTEAVVDALLGRAMSRSLAAGLYPDAPGAQQVFINLHRPADNLLDLPRPHAVVVAGLGHEGRLRATDLAYSVCQAVLAYAQRVAERSATEFEMAATLVGSGGSGISAGAAAQAVAQGAFDARRKLRQNGGPALRQLILVELFLDRASEAWRSLQVQATAAPGQIIVAGPVRQGTGAMRRSLDASYRGAAYDLISALTGPPENGQPTIAYTLDTRRARTEVRALQAQGTLLRELVHAASDHTRHDARIGRTLFNLLVPVEMEPFLGGTSEMIIELDAGTAVIPWELLDTGQTGEERGGHGTGEALPWAIRSKLLRKLQLGSRQFRAQPSDATTEDHVLVVGEPLCDAPYPALPGARSEALAVAARLGSGANGLTADRLTVLASGRDDARSVVGALFAHPYRALHLAGHGALAQAGNTGGMVLSGQAFLGAAEVQAMRVVPELVFLNCCHLAGRTAETALAPFDRAGFAANIAEALIGVGVRCVIAAGWAVEDGPAEIFATTFYEVLLRGERFIDAVAAARSAAWRANPQGSTWAAYQCYGDPGWTWRRSDAGTDTPRAPPSLAEEFAGVSSPVALTLALENLVVRMRFGGGDPALQHGKVAFLAQRHGGEASLEDGLDWSSMGAVAESFGLAFAEAQDLDQAIAWYRRALAAHDGSASLRAAEQLGNLLARRGELSVDLDTARKDIAEALHRLQQLAALQPTPERHNLLGSACKRQAMVANRERDTQAEIKALREMVRHYGLAETTAAPGNAGFYAALNGMAGALRLALLEGRPARIAADRLTQVRAALQDAAERRPDFWSVVGGIELRLLQALTDRTLVEAADALRHDLQDLKTRVSAPAMWASVYAQARFVLGPYRAQAGAPDARAADDLLSSLEAMAAG